MKFGETHLACGRQSVSSLVKARDLEIIEFFFFAVPRVLMPTFVSEKQVLLLLLLLLLVTTVSAY